MQRVIYSRGSIAIFCIAILLVAALIPVATGLPFAILVQFCLLGAALVTLAIGRKAADCALLRAPFLSPVGDRAPPIR